MTDLKDDWPRGLLRRDLWKVAPLSDAARARLIARAAGEPQLLPWPQAAAAGLERALSEWRYGLAYKLAAACACVALGLGIGLHVERHDHDVTGLAFLNANTVSAGELSE